MDWTAIHQIALSLNTSRSLEQLSSVIVLSTLNSVRDLLKANTMVKGDTRWTLQIVIEVWGHIISLMDPESEYFIVEM